MPHEIHGKKDPRIEQCIDVCLECQRICESAVPHCLSLGGRHAAPEHITLLLDCARICATGAEFMMRSSHHYTRVCAVCADVCQACAQACDMFKDDEMMRRCADICRRCADSCRQMAGVAVR